MYQEEPSILSKSGNLLIIDLQLKFNYREINLFIEQLRLRCLNQVILKLLGRDTLMLHTESISIKIIMLKYQ